MFISKELNMLELRFFFFGGSVLCVVIKHTTQDYGTKGYASWWKIVCVCVCTHVRMHKHRNEEANTLKLGF